MDGNGGSAASSSVFDGNLPGEPVREAKVAKDEVEFHHRTEFSLL